MVIGSTMPGNSTVLRTGTTMSASGGNGGTFTAAPEGPVSPASSARMVSLFSLSATGDSSLGQSNKQTAVDGAPVDRAVPTRGEAKTALKPALRQFEPMNDGGTQLRRENARARDHQI